MNAPRPAAGAPVVVVGAGPVGSAAALLLADRGVSVTMVERYADPYPLPRAVHLDDEVCRILDDLGVVDDFLAASRPGSGLRLLDAEHRVMGEFTRSAERSSQGYPEANMFDQPELEALLRARLDAHPLVTMLTRREVVAVTGLRASDDPAAVGLVTVRHLETAEEQQVPAAYVLGCDGANSTVRDLVGVEMEDLGFTERWLVIDVVADRDLDVWDGVEQVCDPARAATFMQLVGRRYRFEFQLAEGEDADDLTAPVRLAGLLRPWTGREDLSGLEVVRQATYTFKARLASSWRDGRIFLLGDAAHLTPPFIGQGLAAGLRDAHNISWKLAAVVLAGADEELLDSYEEERRPHARALVKKAVMVGWAMTGGQDRAAAVRRVALSVLCRIPGFAQNVIDTTTPRLRGQVALRAGRTGGRQLVGTLVPNVLVPGQVGEVALDELLAHEAAVVTCEDAPAAVALAAEAAGLPVVVAPGLPRTVRQAARRGLLVRADGVVAAVGGSDLTGLAPALLGGSGQSRSRARSLPSTSGESPRPSRR